MRYLCVLLLASSVANAQDAEGRVRAVIAMAMVSPQPPQPAVMKYAAGWDTRTQKVVVHEASASHTHTCPNASCPFRKEYGEPYVWNHAMTAGHVCPYCNLSVPIHETRDNRGRIVGRSYVTGNGPLTLLKNGPSVAASPPRAVPVTTIFQGYAASSSGCANGQCSTASRGRFR